MRQISGTFSHINLEMEYQNYNFQQWSKPFPLEEILKSKPKQVNTYDELVKAVAQINFRNRNFTLYYRGQKSDYKSEGQSTILPSIYRKKENEKRLMLKERFDLLNDKVKKLKDLLKNQVLKLSGSSMLNKYPEIAWSLLQHYEVCDTPLLDLTQSLHVACSFAFDNNIKSTGIIYAFGMPWVNDSIGYNTFEELFIIRLLSICPPEAQRPFFQEGYLAGPFPNYQLDDTDRVKQFDFGRRLIAKFEIPIDKKFWGSGFDQIPNNKLYQPYDKMKKICEEIKNDNGNALEKFTSKSEKRMK